MWMLIILVLANPHDVSPQAIAKSGPYTREKCVELVEAIQSSVGYDTLINPYCEQVN